MSARTETHNQIIADKMMKEWAENKGLKQSNAQHSGLHFLEKAIPASTNMRDIPAGDHVTYWNKDGKPYAVVSQPYAFRNDEVITAAAMMEKYGLSVCVQTWPSWHFPGSVITMIWTRKGAE